MPGDIRECETGPLILHRQTGVIELIERGP